MGGKAQHGRNQPVAGVAALQQTEVLLDQAPRELQRRPSHAAISKPSPVVRFSISPSLRR